MSNFRTLRLLGSTSAIAVGIALATTVPASAFDEVNWTWNALIDENIIKTGLIEFTLEPTGMVMLEDLQVFIGDVTATSVVTGISNNQPNAGNGGGAQEIDLGVLQFTGNYDNTTGNVTGAATAADLPAEIFLVGVVNPEDPFGVTMNFDLGTITVEGEPGEATGSYDALTELPEVISLATAVANNLSIESDAAVQLHSEQWVVGDVALNGETNGSGLSLEDITGATPSVVSASSTVYDILNATVDSQATAVVNNLSVNVEAVGSDRLVIADVTQVAYADVTASSTVYDVDLNNYLNLGALDRPIVNSVATAVGNNMSISVSAPTPIVTP